MVSKPEKQQAFAILRIDDFQGQDVDVRNRVTVKRIMWDQTEAEAEVERLNARAEGVRYSWQATRVDTRDS